MKASVKDLMCCTPPPISFYRFLIFFPTYRESERASRKKIILKTLKCIVTQTDINLVEQSSPKMYINVTILSISPLFAIHRMRRFSWRSTSQQQTFTGGVCFVENLLTHEKQYLAIPSARARFLRNIPLRVAFCSLRTESGSLSSGGKALR